VRRPGLSENNGFRAAEFQGGNGLELKSAINPFLVWFVTEKGWPGEQCQSGRLINFLGKKVLYHLSSPCTSKRLNLSHIIKRSQN